MATIEDRRRRACVFPSREGAVVVMFGAPAIFDAYHSPVLKYEPCDAAYDRAEAHNACGGNPLVVVVRRSGYATNQR